MAYAYRPTTREDLLDKFKEHNWWIPSLGELIRFAYLYQEYYNPSNSDDVDNPLNVFKDAIEKKIITIYSNLSSSVEPSANYTNAQLLFTMYYNSTYHQVRLTQGNKTASYSFYGVCAF